MAFNALLATKLHIPPLRPSRVRRERLLGRLDESLRPGCRLALICAPAGFGKTTLLSEWQARLAVTGVTLAWISLDDADNDLVRFLRYITAALKRLYPEIGETTLSLLDQPQLQSVEIILTSLLNELAEIQQDFVLVLDDYHLIHDLAVHQAVGFLLDHQPAAMRLVIVTRQDPFLPLARLRARGQICEIRAPELRFNDAEAAEFLQAGLGIQLTSGQIAALEDRTEGWIAGLQMAALALQGSAALNGQADIEIFLSGFSGAHHYVFDYLAQEVLNQQGEEIIQFLSQTAFLERLSPGLCDAVTGRSDSQQLLRRIEQANLFLSPIDDQHQWYRYHRLFADFLRSQGSPANLSELHQRAADWFEQNGLPREAMGHFISASDWPAARRLFLAAAMPLFMDGEITQLQEWLNAFPADRIQQDCDLLIYKGMVFMMKNQLKVTQSAAEQAEKNLLDSTPPESQGLLYCLKAYLARVAGQDDLALSFSRTAINHLGETNPPFRSMLLSLDGQILRQMGEMAEAEKALNEAVRLGSYQKNSMGGCIAQSNLGWVINLRGQRRRADAYFREAISRCVDGRGRELPVSLFMYSPWAGVAYDADQVELASQYLEKEFIYCQQMGINPILVGGCTTIPLMKHALGDIEGALSSVRELHDSADQYQIPWVSRQASALEALFRLQLGDLESAEAWARAADVFSVPAPIFDREFEIFCLARIHIAQQRYDEALAALTPIVALAESGECWRSLITLELLQAMIDRGQGRVAVALRRTLRALSLAAPENYLRLFLDEGQPVIPLLEAAAVHAQGEQSAFAAKLLALFTPVQSAPEITSLVNQKPLTQAGLVEPLSPRELEVLGLMADGLSNADISRKLYLTLNTLKAHTNSIYGKLDVHSRMQAVNKARGLGLI